MLPHDADTLRINFTLKILGKLEEPVGCNNPDFANKLKELIKAYNKTYKFEELAARYANNIASGRFLWNNRVGAESIKILVKHKNGDLEFNGYNYKLNQFEILPLSEDNLNRLISIIQNGLSGNTFEYLEIFAYAKLGFGQRVWPSQEMILNIPKGEKSKILFQLNNCAGIHSEKIGNALRTIDTWYKESDNDPIAVEPFGSVPTKGDAFRKSRIDFYTLLENWIKQKDITADEQHYIVAVLIRGGVFGEKDSTKNVESGGNSQESPDGEDQE